DIRTIFGTRLSVCSWICVTACRMLTASPTTIATTSTGAPTISATYVAFRTKSTAVSRDMNSISDLGFRISDLHWPGRAPMLRAAHAVEQHSYGQRPAVDEHEQQQLEWKRNQRRREHHHPHAHQHGGDDHIDDQERQKNLEADDERHLQLTQ